MFLWLSILLGPLKLSAIEAPKSFSLKPHKPRHFDVMAYFYGVQGVVLWTALSWKQCTVLFMFGLLICPGSRMLHQGCYFLSECSKRHFAPFQFAIVCLHGAVDLKQNVSGANHASSPALFFAAKNILFCELFRLDKNVCARVCACTCVKQTNFVSSLFFSECVNQFDNFRLVPESELA